MTAISFSQNGNLLICGDSGFRVNLWNVLNKEVNLISINQFNASTFFQLVIDRKACPQLNDDKLCLIQPQRKYILTCSLDNKAIIYNTSTFNKEISFDYVHKRGINYAIFGIDGHSIITCGSDNLIKVFDTKLEFNY